MNEPSVTLPSRSRQPLWLLILVFTLPVAAAWFLNFINHQYLPSGRSNRGELMQPPVSLPKELPMRDAMGRNVDRPSSLDGRWTLMVLALSPCDQECRKQLRDIRQVRLALGEKMFGLERLLLLVGADANSDLNLKELAGDLDGAYVIAVDRMTAELFLSQLGSESSALDRVYILDPLGRLMMRYASHAQAKDIHKDIERLLKASKNWIKGAQYGHR